MSFTLTEGMFNFAASSNDVDAFLFLPLAVVTGVLEGSLSFSSGNGEEEAGIRADLLDDDRILLSVLLGH